MKKTFRDNGHIDRLEEGLYSRAHPDLYTDERAEIGRPETSTPTGWEGERLTELLDKSREEKEQSQGKLFKRILLGSVVFFVLALGLATWLYFGGSNFVSANNIAITISGPTSVAGGEELSLDVLIENKNDAVLEDASLTLEYPDGSRVAGDITEELLRQRESVGTIEAHGQVRKTMKSVLFGEKDTIQQIKATLEYRIQGSSAVFFKDKNYDISIKSAPIIITADYPSEISSNQDFQFTFDVSSNSTETLRNILIVAEYPFGFTFKSSAPAPSSDVNVWNIGDLAPGDKRTIRVRGVLQGQNEEERTFRFSGGIADGENERRIGTTLVALSLPVTVQKPLLDLSIAISGEDTGDHTTSPGASVPVNIVWMNNLPSQLVNGVVEVKLTGAALDRSSVKPLGGGYYRSSDNTIVWDRSVNDNFSSIAPGSRGVLGFSFASESEISSGGNQDIGIVATFRGTRTSGGSGTISTEASRIVKLASELRFIAKGLRSTGAFENEGPYPPQAEKETTYTIVWSLSNSLNDISGAKVSATLPLYVTWDNLVSPSQESVSYDQVANRVTWNVGTLKGGSGFTTAPREMSFRVRMTPSLGQVGTSPILVNTATLTGQDTFAGKQISMSKNAVTIRVFEDPDFKEGDGVVVK